MRVVALLAELGPLHDAEAVLLVDDDQAEAGEGNLLLDQRVGADQDVDLAGGGHVQDFLLPLAGRAAGEQPEGDGAVHVRKLGAQNLGRLPRRGDLAEHPDHPPEEFPHRGEVLLGEDFRRGHERGLLAVCRSGEERGQRHHCLAAAHVALEQAGHGHGAGEVIRHVAQGLALGRRRLESQRC